MPHKLLLKILSGNHEQNVKAFSLKVQMYVHVANLNPGQHDGYKASPHLQLLQVL